MKKKKDSLTRVILVFVLVCSVGFGFAARSVAQEGSDEAGDQTFQLEEIKVTAQGREESLDDVPVSVSVFSGEKLDDYNIISMLDVSVRMPNLNIVTAPFDFLNIRGVGSGNNGGFQQSVGIFVDGLYHGRSRGSQAALFDIDRMEVLKGPQTTFFGANSIAGALNITTRGPGQTFDYNISALYGTDGEYNLQAGVDVPLGDTLNARFAAMIDGMDGYIDTRAGKAPNRDSKQARLSLVWEPSDKFQSDFRVSYGTSDTKGGLAFQLVGCPAPDGSMGVACANFYANNGGMIDDTLDYHSDTNRDYITFDFVEAVWTNTFDVGDSSKLISKTGYWDHSSDSLFTGIPFPAFNTGASGLPPFLGQLPDTSDALPVEIDEAYDQFSQEIRFQTDTGGFFDFMVGAYYSKGNFDDIADVGFFFIDFGTLAASLPFPHGLMPGDYYWGKAGFTSVEETQSAFVALNLRPTDRLTINLGGRYTRFDKEAHRTSVRGRTDANGDNYVQFNETDEFALNLFLGGSTEDFSPSTRTDKDFMPSISMQYDLTDDVMGYISYSEGFKAGGFSTGNGINTFEPEYVDAYEAGLKGTFMNRRLMAGLTYFYNDYTDMQEAAVITSGVTVETIVRNAAATVSKGFEFDASFLVGENLVLTTSLALLDSHYEDFPNGACTMKQGIDAGGSANCTGQDLSGKKRAYAPDYSGNIGAEYTFPVGSYDVKVAPLVYFTDDINLSAEADPWLVQDAYAKIDLTIGLTPASKKWNVSLIGKNLTDEVTSSYGVSVSGSDGSARHLVERGRSAAVQFNLHY